MSEVPRSHYRREVFGQALARLEEAAGLSRQRPLTPLEKEGLVQRFEYTWELGWKLLKDQLEEGGVTLTTITPASVIRAASEARLIPDAQAWLDAMAARNRLAHTYNEKSFERAVVDILDVYLQLFCELRAQSEAMP